MKNNKLAKSIALMDIKKHLISTGKSQSLDLVNELKSKKIENMNAAIAQI